MAPRSVATWFILAVAFSVPPSISAIATAASLPLAISRACRRSVYRYRDAATMPTLEPSTAPGAVVAV